VRQWLKRQPWRVLARDNQLPPPGDWRTWLVLAGRGFGKTRTGAEWVHANHDRYARWHLVGPTASSVRDVMIEGESGILAVARENRPKYEPSKLRLTWPNGSVASLFSADEPDRLRGPQCEAAWADEVAVWRHPEAWDMLQLGLRLGPDPRQIVTTTPRPVRVIRELLADANTVTVRGSTYENRANLAPAFFSQIITRYEGTRLGRQELYAELLDDVPGALWTRAMLENRAEPQKLYREGVLSHDLQRVVVAIDPAVSASETSDETGIVVAGLGNDKRGYVLADRSVRASPDAWARRAVTAYREFKADRIVAESNNGGEMVALTIRTVDPNVPVTLVHASRGKRARAEPVAALYEQGRISHVEPFPDLEDQLCSYTPESGDSPDRMDALVWALTDLMLTGYSGSTESSWIA
jgi:predicted phage terminase large subunit-like protein